MSVGTYPFSLPVFTAREIWQYVPTTTGDVSGSTISSRLLYILQLLFYQYCCCRPTVALSESKPTRAFAVAQLLQPLWQEAPLTLKGQRGRCRNIKGDLQIFGSFPSPRIRLLFLCVCFFGGSWQTQVVHHCVNIEGNPQILGSTPSAGPCLPFLLRVVLSWALANSRCLPNLKSLAPAVA